MNIYVGNLPRVTTEAELRQAFEAYGRVATASVIKDKFSGESRGFGFVEMPERSEAQAAIAAMNGKDFGGRTLTVNEARPREERPRDGGGARKWDDRRGGGGAHRDRNRPGGSRRRF